MLIPNSDLISRFDYDDLVEYIQDIGWHLNTTMNEKWLVFEGVHDIESNPIEVVLPRDPFSPSYKQSAVSAINILCALSDIEPDEIIYKIRYHDRDVLKVSNPETGDHDSIPLRVASQQVAELRQLVAYSACSEENQKPFYLNAQSQISKRMVDRYQFGHTFRGSFGFTVETPAISRLMFTKQQSAFQDLVSDQIIAPTERRVMERIIWGLILTEEATETKDVQKIIKGYKQGFNSNMCRAIVNMSISKRLPLDYAISWSARMAPHNEKIRNPGVIRLNSDSYEHLEYAAEILGELEPEEVKIKGLVTDLKADDNPLGLDTSRSVIIRWNDEVEGRVYKVFVVLNKEDYIQAINAHKEWLPVSISGTLKRIKNNWKIVDYHDFKIG